MKPTTSILVAGSTGLIGRAILKRLTQKGYNNLYTPSRQELDLCDKQAVQDYFSQHTLEIVILAAGKVGGIHENASKPATFLTENLLINLNVLSAAQENKCARVINFGSSCMYPKKCKQPMTVEDLYTGKLEPTSIAYASAKLASFQLCLSFNQQFGTDRFLTVIPNSAYGPGDNFNPESGHVLSALISRFHHAIESKLDSITLWGSGQARREFIFSEDIADAVIFLLENNIVSPNRPINIGFGEDISIKELATIIKTKLGYSGSIEWDKNKPEGSLQKLLDNSVLANLGWVPKTNLETGICATYDWYLNN